MGQYRSPSTNTTNPSLIYTSPSVNTSYIGNNRNDTTEAGAASFIRAPEIAVAALIHFLIDAAIFLFRRSSMQFV